MVKALKARLEALEAVIGDTGDNGPRMLIIARGSAKKGAVPFSDDDITGMTSTDATLIRAAGETVADMEARAEAIPPQVPGGVRCWIRTYKDDDHEHD